MKTATLARLICEKTFKVPTRIPSGNRVHVMIARARHVPREAACDTVRAHQYLKRAPESYGILIGRFC